MNSLDSCESSPMMSYAASPSNASLSSRRQFYCHSSNQQEVRHSSDHWINHVPGAFNSISHQNLYVIWTGTYPSYATIGPWRTCEGEANIQPNHMIRRRSRFHPEPGTSSGHF